MRRQRLINKKGLKKTAGKCYFCPESDYDLLDVHRICEGADGGRYTLNNCLVVCVLCHRKITTGKIITHRKHLTSGGRWILSYTDEDGVEKLG